MKKTKKREAVKPVKPMKAWAIAVGERFLVDSVYAYRADAKWNCPKGCRVIRVEIREVGR